MRTPFSSLAVRLPVKQNDLLGVRVSAVKNSGTETMHAAPGAVLGSVGGDPKQGDKITPLGTSGGWRLNLTARFEADADGDGFGDETQDACPTDAATQGACPPPPAPPVVPAPPVLPPAPDRVAPKLTPVKPAARQKASRPYVELRVRADEAARIAGTATARIAERRRTLKLAPVRTTAPAGATTVVRFRLGKAAPALRSAVRRRKAVRIDLRLVARDAAGNTRTLEQAIKLTR